VDSSIFSKLTEAARDQGQKLWGDAASCRSILLDYCGREHDAEIALLANAVQIGIPPALLAHNKADSIRPLIAAKTQEFQARFFVTEDAAHWAIGGWAFALGMPISKAELSVKGPPPTKTALPGRWKDAIYILGAIAFLAILFGGAYYLDRRRDARHMEAAAPSSPDITPFENDQNTLGMKFVKLPGTEIFWSVWETRVADFKAYIQERPEKAPGDMLALTVTPSDDEGNFWHTGGYGWNHPEFDQTDRHPVIGVSYEDATGFCQWLNEKERPRLAPAKLIYRLPTESEWREAAGYKGTYPWGDNWADISRRTEPTGNYAGIELRGDKTWPRSFKTLVGYHDGQMRTARVGSFPPNRFGLFDMDGNASEWCTAANPATTMAACGGSWCSRETEELSIEGREELPAGFRSSRVGFRIVAAPER